MFSLIIMLATVAILGLIFAKPKWGSFLIWPILFTYPHGWWFYHQFLPLNIGVDDLFCIVLFLVVLIRRNFLGGVPFRFGYAFWVISAFTVVAAIANIAGSRDAPPFERILYVKDILKLGIYWCLFYAIIHCIDNERDLKMQLTMFSIAAALGAVIVILQYFFPYQMKVFAAPYVLEAGGLGFRARAAGAFMNPNSAASVLVCSSALIIAAIRLQKRFIFKIIIYSLIFVLFTAVLVTRSRSGLIALAGTLVLMVFWGKGKKFAWFIIAAVIIISVVFAGIREMFTERIRETYDVTTGMWTSNVVRRVQLWGDYFRTATPQIYIFGQGFRQGVARNEVECHSTYVSLITIYGIGGVIWAIVALIIFFRKALSLRHFYDPMFSTVSACCIWALIAWGIYGIADDGISSQYTRYLLFYFVVLLDRAYRIAQEQEELLSYEEETGRLEIPYTGAESY